MPASSRIALFSLRIAVLAVALCIAGVTAARFGLVAPYLGFRIFGLGLVPGSLTALILGTVGFFKTRSGGALAGSALAGMALGIALLVVLVVLVAPHRGAPPIHDITTNPDDPPVFREIAKLPENEGRDLTYPHGGATVTARQRSAYPDLEPIHLALSTDEAFDAAQAAVDSLGWTVVWSNRMLGVIEASETTSVFRFVDDVAIRIREAPAGCVVDVRSTSRVGVSDLGENARRIREFASRLR